MAIAVAQTGSIQRFGAATSFNVSNIGAETENNLLVMFCYGSETDSKSYSCSGWTSIANQNDPTPTSRNQVLWKLAGASEGTYTVNVSSGSEASAFQIVEFSGINTADPTNSGNNGSNSVTGDPWVITANTITGVSADSWLVCSIASPQSRSITTWDADLTAELFDSGGTGGSLYAAYQDMSGAGGNPEYSIDITSSGNGAFVLFEIAEAGSGPNLAIFQRHYRARRE